MEANVLLAHGGGGLLSSQLIRELILPRFGNPQLDRLDDSAVFGAPGRRLAFTTDSYVVSPIFFPGGNIGDLAVCGTVNDLAMAGAIPRFLSLSLIVEEGLPISDLERILDSAAQRAKAANVTIACGDTKVVPKGEADALYINTAGIGVVPEGVDVCASNAGPGDRIIVSGAIGLHGLAVMLSRGDFNLSSPVESDVAPLGEIVAAIIDAGVRPRVLRDLTRGGLAMALCDIAEGSGVTLEVREAHIPTTDAQSAACDILGLDPLNVACEGRFLAVVAPDDVDRAMDVMSGFDGAAGAALVGTVRPRGPYAVELVTPIGSRRVLTAPRGEQMPRIC